MVSRKNRLPKIIDQRMTSIDQSINIDQKAGRYIARFEQSLHRTNKRNKKRIVLK